MRIGPPLSLLALLGLAACGGSSQKLNAYLGTLSVTSVGTAVACTPGTTHTVKFDAGSKGVDVHTVSAAGGDCLEFTNDDTVAHWPGSYPLGSCVELDAPAQLAHGESFTTVPLNAVKTCNWQDQLNPPPPPGSGGGY